MIEKIFILIGPPGSGKGTLSDYVVKNFPDYIHLAPGDIFRDNIRNNTPLGQEIKTTIEKGLLVSNIIVSKIMKDAIFTSGKKNIILDGYPRSVEQNESFLKMMNLQPTVKIHAIFINITNELILKRLVNRIICSKCGEVYNTILLTPKVKNVCDKCHGILVKRSDDNQTTILDRIKVFYDQTDVITNYYRQAKLLTTINGNVPYNQFLTQAKGIF